MPVPGENKRMQINKNEDGTKLLETKQDNQAVTEPAGKKNGKNTVPSKYLPRELQPYERCMDHGPEVLNDAELLAVILRCGSRGENSVELSARLLAMGDLAEITSMSTKQLTSIRGIGTVKATQLRCIGELAKRICSKKKKRISLNTPDLVASYFMEDLCREDREMVYVVLLDTKCGLIRSELLSVGTIDHSLVSSRELFLIALRHNAAGIVLVHNHPSGDPAPSTNDIEVTREIAKASDLMKIPLKDHIIIGDHTFISLKELGILL